MSSFKKFQQAKQLKEIKSKPKGGIYKDYILNLYA